MKAWWRRLTGAHGASLDVERLAAGDPWLRLPHAPPLAAYGPGLVHDFHEFLAGSSRIAATSPEIVARWLLECRYAADAQLLAEHDHWLHPATFELVRSGDCEDYALWGWRKLVDAGYDADFVVGLAPSPAGDAVRHAWVVYRDAALEYILDGVQRRLERAIRPRTLVGDAWIPQAGADARGRRFAFAGLFRSAWGRKVTFDAPDA